MADDLSEALRESEQRYRILFEQAPVGVFVFDRSLVLRECNARFVEILRTSHEKLIGLDLAQLKDKSVLPAMKRALTGEVATYEGPYAATTSEAKVAVSIRLAPMRDKTGSVVGGMAVVEDITERLRAESAVLGTQHRLAQHVKRSPLAIIAWNLAAEVTEWNEAAVRIFGFAEADAIGQKASFIVPASARDHVEQIFRALWSKQGGERSINENVTKDGRRILCDWYNTPLVDEHGNVVGVASMVDDITERKAAEDALTRSLAQFRLLIERAPDAIGVFSHERRLVYANAALARLLGAETPTELIGMYDADPIHPDDRHILEARKPRLAKSEILPAAEYRMVRRDGTVVHVEVQSMPVEYDGRPAVLSFARDLTERRLMQARLLLAVRMVSVGTLAAGVAHEINNPLAYLMANLDMIRSRRLPQLAAGVALDEAASEELGGRIAQITEMLDIAREGADRVRNIVRDLKTFSRGDDERRGPVDVRRILDASINMAWNEIRHRARLIKEYDNVPPIEANESRVGQVFLNLLVNAAQALPVGGAAENSIRVRARTDEAGNVVVEVTDTGPGIPPEMQARIFDPFFTTKPIGVGTGLGLWICEGIVTGLGGTITVESQHGKGATFRVLIPRGGSSAPATIPPSAGEPAASRRGRVLVVDDEVALVRTVSSALIDENDVVTTNSGREALDLLAGDDRFDVILCDLMMPDVTGMDLYEKVMADKPLLASKFVFLTGGAFTARAREFLDGVRAPRIEKPFEITKLLSLVRGRVASIAAGRG